MKTVIILFIAGFLFLSDILVAQDTVQNGGFEQWRLKEFLKCCGRNIDVPYYWGITEQLTGLNYNKFTFRETDSQYVHSGVSSMELFSDTTYLNNLVLVPGIVAYGAMTDSASTEVTIGPVIESKGLSINSNPYWLSFYMDMVHDVADTPYYCYVFTRWDSIEQQEDTLAYTHVDIPDNPENMNQWVQYIDTIHYTAVGTADTVRILFFGGRFGDTRLQGNATYLDDVSFYYPTTGLVALNGEPILQIFPNPASNMLIVKTGEYKPGNVYRIFDATGRLIETASIESYSTSINISKLVTGDYFYSLIDKNNTTLTRGKFTVVR